MSIPVIKFFLLTCVICIVKDTFSPMMSQSWMQMHWSVAVWAIANLYFVVRHPEKRTKLQNVQNFLTCFITGASRFTDCTDLLRSLSLLTNFL